MGCDVIDGSMALRQGRLRAQQPKLDLAAKHLSVLQTNCTDAAMVGKKKKNVLLERRHYMRFAISMR